MRVNIEVDQIRSSFCRTEFFVRGSRACMALLYTGSISIKRHDANHTIDAPTLLWIPTGHNASLSVAPASRGLLLRIPETQLGLAMPTGSIAGFVRFAVSQPITVHTSDAALVRRLGFLFDEIERELDEANPGSQTIILNCLSLLLINLWRSSNPKNDNAVLLPRQIVHEFLALVELHLHSHWKVERYAKHLGVSRSRLTSATQRATDLSPNRYIQRRLAEEAKILLLTSDLTVAEIAYKLGFTDAAYFNRFFQRHAKLAPGRFRREMIQQNATSTKVTEYFAWP